LTRPLAKGASTRQRLRDGLPIPTGKPTLRELAGRQELVKSEKPIADCIFYSCFQRLDWTAIAIALFASTFCFLPAIDRELMAR
jgi:hypothetical protein